MRSLLLLNCDGQHPVRSLHLLNMCIDKTPHFPRAQGFITISCEGNNFLGMNKLEHIPWPVSGLLRPRLPVMRFRSVERTRQNLDRGREACVQEFHDSNPWNKGSQGLTELPYDVIWYTLSLHLEYDSQCYHCVYRSACRYCYHCNYSLCNYYIQLSQFTRYNYDNWLVNHT